VTLAPLPESYSVTRDGLHALAEHVIAPARHRADGHIGLVPTPGGFGTPHFGEDERIRVDGTELVHERPGSTRRVAITTIHTAAQFLGTEPGAPTDLYRPATAVPYDAALGVTVDGSRALAEWIEFAASLLDEVRSVYAAQSPSGVQLWPEHFDLACDLGDDAAGSRATYGASPGDDDIAQPYLYVGPWAPDRRTGVFTTCAFGAAFPYDQLLAAPGARAAGAEFLLDCAALLVGSP
jgi:hypothetical protein